MDECADMNDFIQNFSHVGKWSCIKPHAYSECACAKSITLSGIKEVNGVSVILCSHSFYTIKTRFW